MVECKKLLSCVGAMKIARNVAVSGRYDEWYAPLPAPSLRELLSAAKLRECRPMVPPGRWFTHSFLLALKFLSGYVHRSTLPQSRIRSTAPSEREPGWGAYHSMCRPETVRLAGDFHRPYETQKFLHFTIQRATPMVSTIMQTAPSFAPAPWAAARCTAPGIWGCGSAAMRRRGG